MAPPRQAGVARLESLPCLGGQPVGVGRGRVELGEPAGDADHSVELPAGEHRPQLSLQGGDVTAAAGFIQPGSDIRVFRLGVEDGLVMRDRASPVLLLFGLKALRIAGGKPRLLVFLLHFLVVGQLARQGRQLGDRWRPVAGRSRGPVRRQRRLPGRLLRLATCAALGRAGLGEVEQLGIPRPQVEHGGDPLQGVAVPAG